MPTLNLVPAAAEDYRALAEKRLPRFFFDYVDGGAYGEKTLARNVDDFERMTLRQSVMRNVSAVDTSTHLFGRDWSTPIAFAPIGFAGMMARRGETQAVRAAEKAGVPFTLSTVSICSLEEVAAAADKPFWFQLYMLKDRGAVESMLQRARAVGCRTLLFTVDLPVVGMRYRDIRNGAGGGIGALAKLRLAIDYATRFRWIADVGLNGKPHTFGNLSEYVPNATTPADFKEWIDSQFDSSATWKDIEWLRDRWDGDLIIKGVLSPDDAKAAIAAGADGVVVSNHGGRQLDGVCSSIAMTPRVVDALQGDGVVLMDGGVRSGHDVARAIASGASGVLIGRPWVYAVAARGQRGVSALLATFKAELEVAMALTGVTRVDEITERILDQNNW